MLVLLRSPWLQRESAEDLFFRVHDRKKPLLRPHPRTDTASLHVLG